MCELVLPDALGRSGSAPLGHASIPGRRVATAHSFLDTPVTDAAAWRVGRKVRRCDRGGAAGYLLGPGAPCRNGA